MKQTLLVLFIVGLFIATQVPSEADFVVAQTSTGTQVGGTIAVDTVWTQAGSPFVVMSNITVSPGVTLTIEPDVVIKFVGGLFIFIHGTLQADARGGAPIVFTSFADDSVGGDTTGDGGASSPAPGDWQAIHFESDSVDNLLANVVVRYGARMQVGMIIIKTSNLDILESTFAQSNFSALFIENASPLVSDSVIEGNRTGVELRGESRAALSGNTIRDNGTAVRIDAAAGATHFTDNIFSGNGLNGIVVGGGLLPAEVVTWGANAPYVLSDPSDFSPDVVGVPPEGTLVLEPGTVVKGGSNGSGTLDVDGTLWADARGGAPIVFTSLKDDTVGGDTNGDGAASSPAPGDWRVINFGSASTDNLLANVVVRYGGGGNLICMVCTVEGDVGLTILESTIAASMSAGFSGGNSVLTISKSVIERNETGVDLRNVQAVLHYNIIRDNASFGVVNSTSTLVANARFNNWGDPTGPLDASDDRASGGLYNPGGLGDAVSDFVDYSSWAGSTPPTTAVPTGLTAVPRDGGADLNWSANTEADLIGYRIFYGTSSGNLTSITTVGQATSYRLRGLTNGTQYFIAIASINTLGAESAKSLEVVFVPSASSLTISFGNSGPSNPSGTFAEPVNTATGNYFFQRTDMAIPGRGQPTILTRTYNSLDTYSGPLGHGWTHSYNIFLTENPVGSVAIKQGDGREEFYDPTGGGNYQSRFGGVFNTLVKNPDGTFTLTSKDQTELHFNTSGQLTSITDRNGNTLTLQYNLIL
ncbi:MAG: DUF6531 domain-containing protein [Nitrososphaera sp.]|nr:DUF6531 domain-containing protein [Nitrososphaera sp.]